MPEFSNYVEGLDAAPDASGTVLIPASRNGNPVSLTPAQIAALAAGGVSSVNGETGDVILIAADIPNTPAGNITATNVQDAINELDTEKQNIDADLTAIAGLSTSDDDIIQRKAGAWTNRTMAQLFADLMGFYPPKILPVKCTDSVTPIAVATVATFRMPFAMTLTSVRAGLTVAQASGSIFTVDIKEAGTTIFSTLLTIDNTAKTSLTATTPAVISDAALADDAEITVLVTQIGNGSAIELQITLIGS